MFNITTHHSFCSSAIHLHSLLSSKNIQDAAFTITNYNRTGVNWQGKAAEAQIASAAFIAVHSVFSDITKFPDCLRQWTFGLYISRKYHFCRFTFPEDVSASVLFSDSALFSDFVLLSDSATTVGACTGAFRIFINSSPVIVSCSYRYFASS